mgnify:CR=1 FL=1
MKRFIATTALTLTLGTAVAAEGCDQVTFSDVGWTDITATTAVVSEILKGIGYKPVTQVLSVPVTYRSMKDKKIDVFLGNWMPSISPAISSTVRISISRLRGPNRGPLRSRPF